MAEPTYHPAAKALHWIIVILIINQWIIAEYADGLPLGLAKLKWLALHKSFGMTVLMLASKNLKRPRPSSFAR